MLQLGQASNDDLLHHLGLRQLMDLRALESDFDSVILLGQQVLPYFEQQRDTFNLQAITLVQTIAHAETGNLGQAIKSGIRATQLYNPAEGHIYHLSLHTMVAGYYERVLDVDAAIHHYEQARMVASNSPDPTALLHVHPPLMDLYCAQGQVEKARPSYEWLVDFQRQYGEALANDPQHTSYAVHHLARFLYHDAQYQEAIAMLDQLMVHEKATKGNRGLATTLLQYGQCLYQLGRYREAKEKLEAARVKFAQAQRFTSLVTTTELLTQTYIALGQADAAQAMFLEHKAAKDSLYSRNSAQLQRMAEAEFDTELKEAQIAQQQAELAANEAALESERLVTSKQQQFLMALGIALILLLALLFIGYKAFQTLRKLSSELAQQKAAIEAQNAEKELLLKEIHHRVKNNLQVIIGLLELQTMQVNEDAISAALKEGQSRVKSMGLIHQKLYQTNDVAAVNIADFVADLGTYVRELYPQETPVELDIEVPNIKLDIDTSIPIGLILNELICNAYKYAFTGITSPKIRIALKRLEHGLYELVVSDNGVGMPPELNVKKAKSLGLRLVNKLAKQVLGTVELSSAGGTEFRIEFKDTALRKEVM